MVQNITNYTFNAASKQVTLTGVTASVEKVRLIKNLTTNTYIYKFTDALTISVAGSVITFTGVNTGMSNTDDLLIQYDLDESLDTQLVDTGLVQPLTDAEIRATPLPVSGTVTANTGLTQPLTDTQLRASAVPISASALPLPTGAATEAKQDTANTSLSVIENKDFATETTLDAINDKLPTAVIDMPTSETPSLPVRTSPQKYNDCSFAQVGSGLLTSDFTQISIGTGMAVNQSAGNLVITTGTTTNAEFVARGVYQVNGAQTLKEITTLSQRIANNNFFIELVDVIGDALPYNIVSTTSVDVTKTAHGFTAQNVGQRMDLCALSSVGVPMEGVIASIPDANTIRFTVAGYPASGSGTLSLTGYNKIELLYTGTTATNATFNTRRKGWQNTAVTATINTTASGHLASMNMDNGVCSLSDKTLVAANALTDRTSWDTNIPQPDVNMYVQIRAKNGTTAPASTTTWTIGMVRVEYYISSQVSIVSTRQQSLNTSLPVRIISAPTQAVSGTLTSAGTTTNTPATPTVSSINSAATTNATVVKGSAGTVYGVLLSNINAAARFVKFYNKATAPTVGTDTPIITIQIPANTTLNFPIGELGLRFTTGIGLAITANAADSDTTAVAVSEIKVVTTYI